MAWRVVFAHANDAIGSRDDGERIHGGGDLVLEVTSNLLC
jgi:hypothetical protein